MKKPRREDCGHRTRTKSNNLFEPGLKSQMASILSLVVGWVSEKEMKALQGACVRTSVKAREQPMPLPLGGYDISMTCILRALDVRNRRQFQFRLRLSHPLELRLSHAPRLSLPTSGLIRSDVSTLARTGMEYPCRETTMPNNLSATSATAASDHVSRDVPVQPRAAGHCLAHLQALPGSGALC